jgi:nicotinamidase-related amidase
MRHPLSLLTREVAHVPLTATRTVLLLQDLHAPFTDAADGSLAREARRRFVTREFDEYWDGVPAAVANAGRLLAAARGLGLPVHHVVWGHRRGEAPSALQEAMGWAWDLDGPDGAFPDALRPRPGEAVHAKRGWGALTSPGLRAALADGGIEAVVLAGLPFDFGVRHSCLELADAGYRTLLASDATAALTSAAEAPARGSLAHGATKLRSTAETLDLLARVPAEGTVWV